MLHRIYLIRNAETDDIAAAQGMPSRGPSPTEHATDKRLSANGITQAVQTARRLLQEDVVFDHVYSSPSYQCLETLQPFVESTQKTEMRVRVENGFRVWQDFTEIPRCCPCLCALDRPRDPEMLAKHFPFVDASYVPIVRPRETGWSIERPHTLLLRAHFTMDHIISSLSESAAQNILICAHASVVVAIAQILTAREIAPSTDWKNPAAYIYHVQMEIRTIVRRRFYQHDHDAGNCSITLFTPINLTTTWRWKKASRLNGDQSHLTYEGRPWAFRPTQWQNRIAPNPVRSLTHCLHKPHIQEWILERKMDVVGIWKGLRRNFRQNPYRLPSWVFVALWLTLFVMVLSKTWELDWLHSDPTVVTYVLFMFPPLLRA